MNFANVVYSYLIHIKKDNYTIDYLGHENFAICLHNIITLANRIFDDKKILYSFTKSHINQISVVNNINQNNVLKTLDYNTRKVLNIHTPNKFVNFVNFVNSVNSKSKKRRNIRNIYLNNHCESIRFNESNTYILIIYGQHPYKNVYEISISYINMLKYKLKNSQWRFKMPSSKYCSRKVFIPNKYELLYNSNYFFILV
jgi:hypothetical protein